MSDPLELIEVRCPFQKKHNVSGTLMDCNRICVKVVAGSAGEAWCQHCRLSFEFEVDNQAKPTTGVRVKAIDPVE